MKWGSKTELEVSALAAGVIVQFDHDASKANVLLRSQVVTGSKKVYFSWKVSGHVLDTNDISFPGNIKHCQ